MRFVGSPIHFPQVVLELTEREPIENFTQVRKIVAGWQALGIRIAIDHLGTGHSGLCPMWLKLDVNIIKIDKMIVDTITSNRNSTTISRSWSISRTTCAWRWSRKAWSDRRRAEHFSIWTKRSIR